MGVSSSRSGWEATCVRDRVGGDLYRGTAGRSWAPSGHSWVGGTWSSCAEGVVSCLLEIPVTRMCADNQTVLGSFLAPQVAVRAVQAGGKAVPKDLEGPSLGSSPPSLCWSHCEHGPVGPRSVEQKDTACLEQAAPQTGALKGQQG